MKLVMWVLGGCEGAVASGEWLRVHLTRQGGRCEGMLEIQGECSE